MSLFCKRFHCLVPIDRTLEWKIVIVIFEYIIVNMRCDNRIFQSLHCLELILFVYECRVTEIPTNAYCVAVKFTYNIVKLLNKGAKTHTVIYITKPFVKSFHRYFNAQLRRELYGRGIYLIY